MKILRLLRRFLWRCVPHTCRFHGVTNRRGETGQQCRRCGTAVWFNVARREGETR